MRNGLRVVRMLANRVSPVAHAPTTIHQPYKNMLILCHGEVSSVFKSIPGPLRRFFLLAKNNYTSSQDARLMSYSIWIFIQSRSFFLNGT